jgi:hypothetical protein
MSSITEVAQTMQTLLSETAERAGRASGFVQRNSKVSGAVLAQTLVLGYLAQPAASRTALSQTSAALGVPVSAQALDQRQGERAAACLQAVLMEAVRHVVGAEPVAVAVLQRFAGVYVQDSTTMSLPASLASVWPGCGNARSATTAALKVHLRLDLCTGAVDGPVLTNGRTHDRSGPHQRAALPAGALRIADLGYFDQAVLGQLHKQGVFFLTRVQANTRLADLTDAPLDLPAVLSRAGASVDVPILLGKQQRLPVRLLAVRVPQEKADQRRRQLHTEARRRGQAVSQTRLALADWTILVTNAPAALLSLAEALALARARWQIEILFKLWKSHALLASWRSAKPGHILTEVYAKLLGQLLQHWMMVLGAWLFPDRSLLQAAQTVRMQTVAVINAFAGVGQIADVLRQIRRCLQAGCRVNHRQKHPSTFQLLQEPAYAA